MGRAAPKSCRTWLLLTDRCGAAARPSGPAAHRRPGGGVHLHLPWHVDVGLPPLRIQRSPRDHPRLRDLGRQDPSAELSVAPSKLRQPLVGDDRLRHHAVAGAVRGLGKVAERQLHYFKPEGACGCYDGEHRPTGLRAVRPPAARASLRAPGHAHPELDRECAAEGLHAPLDAAAAASARRRWAHGLRDPQRAGPGPGHPEGESMPGGEHVPLRASLQAALGWDECPTGGVWQALVRLEPLRDEHDGPVQLLAAHAVLWRRHIYLLAEAGTLPNTDMQGCAIRSQGH
mmetsp:Transcript_60416/g.197743  ORF Transcript_60416/g.197743 Transcript_60416/m.197743 type:complete len:287 (+) Transcript_60416:914-1774(+)